MNTEKTLAFLHEVCETALTEARQGDTMLANRLGKNPALSHYFNNVHAVPTMRAEVWAQNYPQLMREADRVREEYERDEQVGATAERVTAIEGQLDELKAMLQTLMENQAVAEPVEAEVEEEEPEPEPEKPKRGRKAKATEEPEPEAETEDEAEAESGG